MGFLCTSNIKTQIKALAEDHIAKVQLLGANCITLDGDPLLVKSALAAAITTRSLCSYISRVLTKINRSTSSHHTCCVKKMEAGSTNNAN